MFPNDGQGTDLYTLCIYAFYKQTNKQSNAHVLQICVCMKERGGNKWICVRELEYRRLYLKRRLEMRPFGAILFCTFPFLVGGYR